MRGLLAWTRWSRPAAPGDEYTSLLHIGLGPLRRDLLDTHLKWDNDRVHEVRTVELSVCLGEEGRGRGLAAPAVPLAARHAYETAGVRVMGTRRDGGYWEGQLRDEVLMEIVPGDM
ncbi:hypothetical protein [Streptomyces mayteni]